MAVLLAQVLGLDIFLGREHLWPYIFGLLASFLYYRLTACFSSIRSGAHRLQHSSMRSLGVHLRNAEISPAKGTQPRCKTRFDWQRGVRSKSHYLAFSSQMVSL